MKTSDLPFLDPPPTLVDFIRLNTMELSTRKRGTRWCVEMRVTIKIRKAWKISMICRLLGSARWATIFCRFFASPAYGNITYQITRIVRANKQCCTGPFSASAASDCITRKNCDVTAIDSWLNSSHGPIHSFSLQRCHICCLIDVFGSCLSPGFVFALGIYLPNWDSYFTLPKLRFVNEKQGDIAQISKQ